MSSQITIHMVASVDGYIARKDGDTSWMQSSDSYEKGTKLTEEYIHEFLSSVDCYLMGSRTYLQAVKIGWPYGETPTKVLTSKPLNSERDTVEFLNGDLAELCQDLRGQFKNIWMVGGARVTRDLLSKKLADKLVVTYAPVLLGDGLPFFDQLGIRQSLHLQDCVAYDDGLVELTYSIGRDK